MVHGLNNSIIWKEEKKALFKAKKAKKYEIKHTSVKKYEVERYQGFHLVYENVIYPESLNWLPMFDSTFPSEYRNAVIVKTLIHVYDPKWRPNKKMNEQILHLPRLRGSVFDGVVLESTDVMTDIFELFSLLKYGWQPNDDQVDPIRYHQPYVNILRRVYDLQVEHELLAYHWGVDLEKHFMLMRSLGLDFHVSSFCILLIIGANYEACRSYEDMMKKIWYFCLQSKKDCVYVTDVSIGYDPISRSIVQQLTKVARIVIDIDSGDSVVLSGLRIETQIPFGTSLVNYCIGKMNHKAIAQMVNSIEMNRKYFEIAYSLQNVRDGCSVMGLFILLKQHVNLTRLRHIARGMMLHDTTKIMMFLWAGEQLPEGYIIRIPSPVGNKPNVQVFSNSLSILYSTNPLYFSNHAEAITKCLMVDVNETDVVSLASCLSRYRLALLPTLQELTRAVIRQHLCRGFSILPKIGEFVTAGILPKQLVEYVFLCHEMSAVCPKIAEDIEELTK